MDIGHWIPLKIRFCDFEWTGTIPAMRNWELLTIALDPRRASPMFVQLSEALANDIRTGRLKPRGCPSRNARARQSAPGAPQRGTPRRRLRSGDCPRVERVLLVPSSRSPINGETRRPLAADVPRLSHAAPPAGAAPKRDRPQRSRKREARNASTASARIRIALLTRACSRAPRSQSS